MQNLLKQEADMLNMIGSITPLPADLQMRINEELLNQAFKRKKILLYPGDTAKRLFFIREGFLRGYFIDDSGKECNMWFAGKGDFAVSAQSFLTQTASNEFIEVLQDCKLESVTWHELNSYYAEFKEGNLLGRIILQKYLILSEQRAVLLRTIDFEQRYDMLLALHPRIEYQVSQKHLASYLAISRETLGRIQRKKRQEEISKRLSSKRK